MDRVASAGYLRDMHTLFDAGTAGGLSDRQLLERFAGGRDAAADSAFEVLVQRHGPMVMRVCHSTLGHQADAHDAFQATFLVLVRKCQSIRRLDSVGSWLFGVASRVARRARLEAARRRAAERQGGLRIVATADHTADAPGCHDVGQLLQAEVDRLPNHLRAVVVLCYWEGLTHEQAAARLGCPLGTVRSRVARARSLLHRRLSRRGLEPVAGVMAAAFDSPAFWKVSALEIPATLVTSSVQMARQAVAGGAVAQLTTPTIAALVRRVIRSMFMTKLRTIAVCLLLIGGGAYGLTLAAPQIAGARKAQRDRAQVPVAVKSKAQPRLKLMSEYVVGPPDLLLVELLEGLPGRPISGERLVRPDGTISLGWYGDLHVAGKTVCEIKADVIKHLQRFLHDDQLGLLMLDEDSTEVVVDRKTGEPKRIDPRDSDRLFVDVTAYNSKGYYMQGEFFAPGRLPVTGQERVLDAISYASGLTPDADHDQMFLYRQPAGGGPVQSLKIDIDQIMLGDDLSTNYQLQPDDKLVVRRRAGAPRPKQPATTTQSASAPIASDDPALYFDRRPVTSAKLAEPASMQHVGDARTSDLQRLERRISDMERKLDLILESLREPAR
jgi:polysaccharide biosynthesis/export protein